ncbi:hypothetical protein BSSC8_23330 [Bacillus subtilis subsp. subtilis str. SC-8]|nr:hypothetical protein BSSC8_23330 [Bacillus subtilis subsp. subtilis str. SC-8]
MALKIESPKANSEKRMIRVNSQRGFSGWYPMDLLIFLYRKKMMIMAG